jgi:hypothetical protein
VCMPMRLMRVAVANRQHFRSAPTSRGTAHDRLDCGALDCSKGVAQAAGRMGEVEFVARVYGGFDALHADRPA